MPTFLSDPTPTHFVVLFVFVVVAVGVWWRNRDRRSLILLAAAGLLLGGLFLTDMLAESPREEAVRRIEEIQAAVNAHKWENALPHFADSFRYRGRTKKDLAAAAGRVNREVLTATTWDFARDQVEHPDERHVVIGFMARGESQFGAYGAYFRVTFEKQADGTWKISTFEAYQDPLRRDTDPPIQIPGL